MAKFNDPNANRSSSESTGYTRIAAFRAWFLIGLMTGIISGIVFVANRSGEFESAQAYQQPPAKEERIPPEYVAGELIVKFNDDIGKKEEEDILFENNAAVKEELSQTSKWRLISVPLNSEVGIFKALKKSRGVRFVEFNEITYPDAAPNDPLYTSQWHLPKISMPAAWDVTQGTASVIIAIVDTGVDSTHPDLASKLVAGRRIITNLASSTDTSDVYGHGTKVAGAAAAITNNGIGVAAPGWNNKIMPIRISDDAVKGRSSVVSQSLSIEWAADNGAKVINVSQASSDGKGLEASDFLDDAINYAKSKGAITIYGSGNCSSTCYFSVPDDPAAMISVGATDSNDGLASFSSRGEYVDLAAPGVSIYTTAKGGGYAYPSGTSFSAPVTAGVVALVFSVNPSLTPDGVRDILQTTADDLGPIGRDTSFGYGRINAEKAVKKAAGFSDTQAPSASIISPLGGATVSGTVSVTVSASDVVGVTRVELWKDGGLFGTDTVSPYEFSWDTTQGTDGSHSLQAKAYDAATNVGLSAIISVTVSNGNIIDNGGAGTSFTGTWSISGALNPYGANSLYSSGSGLDTYRWTPTLSTSAQYEVFMWWTQYVNRSTTAVIKVMDAAGAITNLTRNEQINGGQWNSLGTYTLGPGSYVETNDSNGQVSADAVQFVSVPDTQAPSASIISPLGGATVSGTVSVTVSASDAVGVTRVELWKDGGLFGTDTVSPYEFSWNTTQGTDGSHSLQAKAYDAATNVGLSTIISVTVSNAAGPVAFWKLDDDGGINAIDSSGNNNTGTLQNGPLWTSGKNKGALNFDGSNDFVSVPHSSSLNITGNAITISAWVNVATNASYTSWGIVSKRGWDSGYRLMINNANKVNFSLTGQSGYSVTSANAVTLGQWTHIAGVYDGAKMKIYINGVADPNETLRTGPINSNTYRVTLGMGDSYTGCPGPTWCYLYKGLIDYVKIHNRALSQSEIEQDIASLPIEQPPEIIIDNNTNWTSQTGSWCVLASNNPYGIDSRYSCSPNIDTYRWTPELFATTTYGVFMWWGSCGNCSTTAMALVRDALGAATSTIVNQQINSGQWNWLGTYTLGPGSYVEINDNTSDQNNMVEADAVMFAEELSPGY